MRRVSGESERPTVGIVGFGKVGTVLARLAREAGYRVVAAASGDPERIAMIRDVLAPGVELDWADHVSTIADIVILALPLRAHQTLSPHLLDGKIVVDAINHWPEVDGRRDDWVPRDASTSEYLQGLLPGAKVVKAFNHVGYRDLEARRHRFAIAHASDDRDAAAVVATLISGMGFEPVDLGDLANGRVLEPGSAAFGAALPAGELLPMIEFAIATTAAKTRA
jgi:predicted dinucleotide-binding enzyme